LHNFSPSPGFSQNILLRVDGLTTVPAALLYMPAYIQRLEHKFSNIRVQIFCALAVPCALIMPGKQAGSEDISYQSLYPIYQIAKGLSPHSMQEGQKAGAN
jgi:hypothetical protein